MSNLTTYSYTQPALLFPVSSSDLREVVQASAGHNCYLYGFRLLNCEMSTSILVQGSSLVEKKCIKRNVLTL